MMPILQLVAGGIRVPLVLIGYAIIFLRLQARLIVTISLKDADIMARLVLLQDPVKPILLRDLMKNKREKTALR